MSSLELQNNRLTGTVPTSLSNWIEPKWLLLGNNELGGEFCVNVRGMQDSVVLSLMNNSFTGRFRFDVSISLAVVDLSWNEFSGELSATLMSPLVTLQVLMLGHNKFHGRIPPWIWNLPTLQVLDLSNNYLSGPFSGNFSNLRGFIDNASGEFLNQSSANVPNGFVILVSGVRVRNPRLS